MFDEHRRPVGRLFYLLAFVVVCLERRGDRRRPHARLARDYLRSDQRPRRKAQRCRLYLLLSN